MFTLSKWRVFFVLGAVLGGLVMAAPNIIPETLRNELPSFLTGEPVVLGLDLQGGSHVLLEVDKTALRDNSLKQLRGDIIHTLWRENKIRHTVSRQGDGVLVRLNDGSDSEPAREALQALSQPAGLGLFGQTPQEPEYLIEVRGADAIHMALSDSGLEARISRAIEQSLEILGQRVNALGTTEPTIQRQGLDRIVVQVPGLQDPRRLKRILGQTAKLDFRLLCEAQPADAAQTAPAGCEALSDHKLADQSYWVQTSRRATVPGEYLNDAQPSFDPVTNEPVVLFRFNQKGAVSFGDLTRKNVGRPFAIVLDRAVISAPVIREPILGGSGQISGSFTVPEANELAIVLRSGALPAKLVIVEERTVGPSLGSDSVRAGIIACVIGLIAVFVFMLAVYGLFGVFANIALIANLVLLLGVLTAFQATLTLPGIAGVVLTLGMAVDSNVLVFERIREEVRNGRSTLNAIETGFSRAFATILDANITTFIAAAVLFSIGSGPIRGFAVTLGVGILTTVFTAYTLTRLVVAYWVYRRRPRSVPL